ncbi:MAG: BrnT family toxin [Nitrospira sp.]|nr:BrnT family toxin [Nitrospira sp.]
MWELGLLVVYGVWRRNDEKEIIRIISARQASRKERAAYSRLTD